MAKEWAVDDKLVFLCANRRKNIATIIGKILEGKGAVLIEWQLAPKLWDAIRFEVDHRGELQQMMRHLLR